MAATKGYECTRYIFSGCPVDEDICEILEKMRQFVNIAANSGCKGKLLK